MTDPQGSSEQSHPSSRIPRQGVFENVQAGGDISFRDLLQILLVPGRNGQEPERQGIRHNLPQPDYGQFIGREQELTKIFQKLRPYPHSTNAVITIDGIGGIGKSALALEVAHRFLRDYSKLPMEERFEAIIWSSAKRTVLRPDRGIVPRRQSFQTLEDICKYIAFTLAVEEQVRSNPDEIVEFVCRALTQQRTLLIIDNLETVDDESVMEFLQDLLPAPTKAIVTTRHRVDVAYPVRLVGMPWEDAEQLIEQECQKKNVALNVEEKGRLYDRTGGVPLAIVWTVARLGFGHSINAVLVSLGSPQGDVAHFCFREVISYIKERDAYKLLLALAVCKGEAKREELRYIAGLEEDELSCDEGLVELDGLSLINKKENIFTMLPLTKEYVTHELNLFPDFEKEGLERLSNYKIKPLIAQARLQSYNIFEQVYGKTRLLDGRLINIDDLYVEVHVLTASSNGISTDISQLLEDVEFLNQLRLEEEQKRHLGIDIVKRYTKLVILGKPGSGKSILLRYLGLACCKEVLFQDYVPVLIELRSIRDGVKINLQNIIHEEIRLNRLGDTKKLLNQGRFLILIDGFDELSTRLQQEVQDEISSFCKRYYKNRIIITCRTQFTDYKLPGFDYAEIADFNENQVTRFIEKWFSTSTENTRYAQHLKEYFITALNHDAQVAELSATPVLLSLLCWVFRLRGVLPNNRSKVYEVGLDLLLEGLDQQKGIQRSFVNEDLTLELKKDLLGYIATRKFDQKPGVLFKQLEIQTYISDYLHIPIDQSKSVLSEIEISGLLVEQAKGIYSFSHRAFQEYLMERFQNQQT